MKLNKPTEKFGRITTLSGLLEYAIWEVNKLPKAALKTEYWTMYGGAMVNAIVNQFKDEYGSNPNNYPSALSLKLSIVEDLRTGQYADAFYKMSLDGYKVKSLLHAPRSIQDWEDKKESLKFYSGLAATLKEMGV